MKPLHWQVPRGVEYEVTINLRQGRVARGNQMQKGQEAKEHSR